MQDVGAADRPDDARSGERRGKSSAKKPNTKDNGHAANGNHETTYLANIEEPQPSKSHGGQGQRGARCLRSPNMAGDSSQSDMDSDPSRERQFDSDSDSSDSGEERAARRRLRSRKHKRKSKKSRKHERRKGVTDPRHLATLRVRPALTPTPMTRHHAQCAGASNVCVHSTCAMGHPATLGRNKMAARSASTMPT